MRHIFVRGTGQEDNIGDVVLRRVFFDALSRAGQLHILLGDASDDFIDALQLRESDIVYQDSDAWRHAAYRSVIRRSTWLVDKPGELLLEEDIYKGQRRLLPLILAVRARGGRSLRLGVGQRKANPDVIARFRRLYRLSSVVAWRDVDSHEHFGLGEVMPDWGFLPGAAPTGQERNRLVISYRSDRRRLGPTALEAIRRFAARNQLLITVVTQVARDSKRSQELHAELGGELVDWPSASGHLEQEHRLRDIFAGSAVTLSDRLHVLIVAATEGAVPINLVAEADTKSSRHFEAIGYRDLTVPTDGVEDAEALVRIFDEQSRRSDEIAQRVERARTRIHEVAQAALATGA